ncbi:tetratricopeptide repeat protein [Undibacterium curvum]|uniref:Tetratricopeptide repeat protein n=1 Tax=Undibacterium curvum TaxID=2762294 RepID=A0ABR7A3Z8_9BURK|nr:tetratricopeptide repeat protein [Undibacterium curvum]MBC3931640.1 tetratricopeptide repeat protein [Undibacterium curvum]
MKRFCMLVIIAALSACASTPTAPLAQAPRHDAGFKPPTAPVDTTAILKVSPEMQQFLHKEVRLQARQSDKKRGLFDALQRDSKVTLDYDSSITKTAAETFASRSGNCLSLVLMTAAMAHALDLPVHYQQVFLDESWSRVGNLYVSSGHVNIILGTKNSNYSAQMDDFNTLLIDFLPGPVAHKQRSVSLSEARVLAMFLNNRAAELLAQNQIDDAYWHATAALQTEPNFQPAHNTLGVIYRRHGDLALAETVFRQILAAEPKNVITLSNLVETLQTMGKPEEAALQLAALRQIQTYPPFHFLNLGQHAMAQAQYAEARSLFEQEAKRDPYNEETHFWLAQANLRLGDLREASRQLSLARDHSTTPGAQELYGKKLKALMALSQQR